MDRKATDVTLLENDILYVPDNRGTRAKLSVLEKMHHVWNRHRLRRDYLGRRQVDGGQYRNGSIINERSLTVLPEVLRLGTADAVQPPGGRSRSSHRFRCRTICGS